MPDFSPHTPKGRILAAAGMAALVWLVVVAAYLTAMIEPFEQAL